MTTPKKLKKLCIVCEVGPREVPDREVMGRPIKRVCRKCHALRLSGDLRAILDLRIKAYERTLCDNA